MSIVIGQDGNITSCPRSEPVCTLFMDENEPGRRGKVIDEDVYNGSIPSWCPLDNMIEEIGRASCRERV